MITRENYELGIEYKKKAESIFSDKDLNNFVREYIEYLDKIESINLVSFFRITNIIYTDTEIEVVIDEGEYGTQFITIPIDYVWMNSEQWKTIEKKKHDDKVLKAEKDKKELTEKEEREQYEKLKAKFELNK